jgi:hypothetical protein
MDRLTIPEAARRLGITDAAVRKRYERGTLKGEKGKDGRIYVFVDAGYTERPGEASVVEILSSQVEDLRARLDEANERDRENRRIIAALTSRIPELEAPVSPERPSEGPETATEDPDRAEPRSDAPGRQEAARRPWWRRMFRG